MRRYVGQRFSNLRRFQIERGIGCQDFLDQREAKQIPQGDQVARHGPAVEVLVIQAAQVLDQLRATHSRQRELALRSELCELAQVARVG